MLKKRIIPCLDIKNGRTVKGINFLDIKDAGCPIELAKRYVQEGADELVFLDISATLEKNKILAPLVEQIAHEINIPFTVGGGINTLEEAKRMIAAGADKISVNSAAVYQPQLITELAKELGSQCVVVAIDTKDIEGIPTVFVKGGTVPTDKKTIDWSKEVAQLGAGEILLTSMKSDGTKQGFDIDTLRMVVEAVNIPVIASGGAGTMQHFATLFEQTKVSAALAASIFHFQEISISSLKQYLKAHKIPVRCI